jgi:alcohol dehydrogenase class IV
LSGEIGSFIWQDLDRGVYFGDNAFTTFLERARENQTRFVLLSTPRALASANELSSLALAVREVVPGGVPETAAALLGLPRSEQIVALGGGRVIDTAKAIAGVEGQQVFAIPTTLSGAEMTGIHRYPVGAEERARLVRPDTVIADPELMTSAPENQLRASAMNALGHGADSLYTPFANPVSRMTALRGAALIGESLDQGRDDRDRSALALGSILSGYAIDSAGFAIHHVICQTLVRMLGVPHAETNAAILPHAMSFMRDRAPEQIGALAEALRTDPDSLPGRIAELGRPTGLGELGADPAGLEEALDAIEARPHLGFTPNAPSRDDLKALIEAAW